MSNAFTPARGGQEADERRMAVERDPTGVPHLDDVLGGGLPRGSLTLIMGLPGSGKTTLASQIAFTAAHAGRTVLLLTALSESTTKLIEHLRHFSFFDDNLVGGPVLFLSLQEYLRQGLEATSTAIIDEVRRVKASLVLMDGFRGMGRVDADPQAAREFLYTLGSTLDTLGTTTLVTSETDPRDPTFFPETTTADVILGLHYQLHGIRHARGLEVIKSRASAPLPGLHAMTLGDHGASIYVQLEERVTAHMLGADAQTQGAASVPGSQRDWPEVTTERVAFDLPQLDAMLAGGIPRTTCTLLAGSLGTGKTLMAIYYALAGVRAGEQVIFVGLRESREQLLQAAEAFLIGPELKQALAPGGGLTFLEVPPIKVNVDILADRLFNEIDRTGAQRLVFDSIAEIERAIQRSLDPQRLEDYLAAFLRACRMRQVTALLVKETDKAVAASLDFSADALSILAENVLLLQQIPYEGQLHRILSVLKLRFSDHDATLREFRIQAPQGLQVLEAFALGSVLLEGIERQQEVSRFGIQLGASKSGRPRRTESGDDERA